MREFVARIGLFFWGFCTTYARWRTYSALVEKHPELLRKVSTGGIEILSYKFNGMPTGRTIAFPPIGVAGIVAGIDDQLGRRDDPDRLIPPISERWKDEELPAAPESIRAANLHGIVALGFFRKGRIIDNPTVHDYVMMTYDDETSEQVILLLKISDVLGRLRMGEDHRNVPPVEGAHGSDWWAELRRRYPKETFWVPRQYRW